MVDLRVRVSALASAFAAVLGLPGCGKDLPDGEGSITALTVPVPAVTQFAVLASRAVSVGDRSTVAGGDLGVAAGATNALTTGIDSRVGVGEVLLAPVMTLRDRTNAGEIGATTLNLGAGVVTGPRSLYVAPPAAPAPAAFTPGTTAVTVNAGQTQTLAAGDYGSVAVNGTLNLSGGTYQIQSLRIGPDARITAAASATVRVQGGVSIADRGDLVGPANPGAGGLHLDINGTIDGAANSLAMGVDVQLTAIVVARNTVRAGDRLVARGAVAAQDLVIANDSSLTFDDGFGCGSNTACNDSNPCTTDACVDAVCVFTRAANGTPCTDNNACTQTDTCQAGACTGSNPVACAPGDPCHLAGVCNPASGTCTNPPAPNGTPCSDGNACTQTDTCQLGLCSGSNPIICAPGDQCHLASACSPTTGACTNPSAPDGTPCDDGTVCTTADACRAGACAGTGSIVTEFASGVPQQKQITPGPDGNLWFISTEASPGVGAVARIVPSSGAVTTFPSNAAPRTTPLLLDDIVAAADGNLWFTGRDAALDELPVLGTITPAGTFIVPDLVGSSGAAIALGPDGNLWTGGSFLGVIDAVWRQSTIATTVPVSATPHALVAGPDANVWLVASGGGGAALIARVVPNDLGNEILTEFPVATGGDLLDIAVGPDGNLWFTDAGRNEIGRITTAGVITKFAVPSTAAGVHGITAAPDGSLWFTEDAANKLGRITPAGAVTELACLPTPNSGPTTITVGPDRALWLTETTASKIARVQIP
jgi:streptogramin lyase